MNVNRADRGADKPTRRPGLSAAAGRPIGLVVLFTAVFAATTLSLLPTEDTSAAFTVRATTPVIRAVAPTPAVSPSPSASPSAPSSPEPGPSPSTASERDQDGGQDPSPQGPLGGSSESPGTDEQGLSPRSPEHHGSESPHGGTNLHGSDTPSARGSRGDDLDPA